MGLLDRVRDRGNGQAPKPNGAATPAAPSAPPVTKPSTPGERSVKPATSQAPTNRSAPTPQAGGTESSRSMGQRRAAHRMERKQDPVASERVKALKVRIHNELIKRLDLSALGQLGPVQAGEEIRTGISQLLEAENAPLSRDERIRLEAEITAEVLGFGPLDSLLKDDSISDILVNSSSQVYVERGGRLELSNVSFRDDEHLLQIIERIVSQVGRRIDAASPLVDARLADGSRVNAVIPPIALDGPSLSIRRFGKDPYQIDDLIAFGSITPKMAEFFEAVIRARLNIIVSGGTGSGKTTLLNCLSSFIPHNERVVTVEDAAEIQLQQPHTVRLETRPPNLEGKGQVTTRDLVKNCLRMRPDRIIVGECRGAEALDMLQAMNTGHDGSITTLHANSPRDCLSRLEMMILMAGVELPVMAMRQQVSSAVDIVIQQSRLRDGTRKVMKITEIVGMEMDIITAQDIFEYVITGLDQDGKVVGHFQSTGIRPMCMPRIEAAGIHLDESFFMRGTL